MNGRAGRPRKGESTIVKDENWGCTRAKISHFVRRNNIEKKCVICGKPGMIMHNRENPYFISFICDECIKDDKKKEKAESLRFDIRDKVPKAGTHILRTSTDDYIMQVVDGYLNDTLPIREYCKKVGLSNRQFHVIVDRYKEIYPNRPVAELLKSHRNRVHRHRIQEHKQVDV